jgi:hypothetical protein
VRLGVTHNVFAGHQRVGWLSLFAGQSPIRLPSSVSGKPFFVVANGV